MTVELAQDIESKLIQLIEKNRLEEIRSNLTQIKNQLPHHPVPYYIEAYLEKDGEKALSLYKSFITRFPESNYIPNAKHKIAQFYYAKGLYRSAKQVVDEIIESHLNYSNIAAVHFLSIRCLIALEFYSLAEKEIKQFHKQYPQSPYKKLIESDSEQIKKATPESEKEKRSEAILKKSEHILSGYALQVGAFSDKNNAIKLMKTISDGAYPVEINTKVVNNTLYYVVWVGSFETEEQALSFGEQFKKKYNLTFRIVSRESKR